MRVEKYPCSKCEKLTGGNVESITLVSENLSIVIFHTECCKMKQVRYMTPSDLRHYIPDFAKKGVAK